jgi:hypothetical protein
MAVQLVAAAGALSLTVFDQSLLLLEQQPAGKVFLCVGWETMRA